MSVKRYPGRGLGWIHVDGVDQIAARAEDGADEDDAPVDAEEAKRRLAAKAKAKPKQLSAAATALAEAKARATKGKKGGADKRTFNQAPKG